MMQAEDVFKTTTISISNLLQVRNTSVSWTWMQNTGLCLQDFPLEKIQLCTMLSCSFEINLFDGNKDAGFSVL